MGGHSQARYLYSFAFSTDLMVWNSTAALGLGNGGSAGLLYTNLATWIGFIAVYASLGEQGSMAPTSGGTLSSYTRFLDVLGYC